MNQLDLTINPIITEPLTDEERDYLNFENYVNTAAESEMLAACAENDEVWG